MNYLNICLQSLTTCRLRLSSLNRTLTNSGMCHPARIRQTLSLFGYPIEPHSKATAKIARTAQHAFHSL